VRQAAIGRFAQWVGAQQTLSIANRGVVGAPLFQEANHVYEYAVVVFAP
jgi:hypothetical protein